MDAIQLISAAGIGGIVGSLITTLVQAWLSHKSYIENRKFQEKKEAYIGFIDAFRQVCINSGKEEQKNIAYWGIRCELVANKGIVDCIEKMKTKGDIQQENAFKKVVLLMKKDLGILGDLNSEK